MNLCPSINKVFSYEGFLIGGIKELSDLFNFDEFGGTMISQHLCFFRVPGLHSTALSALIKLITSGKSETTAIMSTRAGKRETVKRISGFLQGNSNCQVRAVIIITAGHTGPDQEV